MAVTHECLFQIMDEIDQQERFKEVFSFIEHTIFYCNRVQMTSESNTIAPKHNKTIPYIRFILIPYIRFILIPYIRFILIPYIRFILIPYIRFILIPYIRFILCIVTTNIKTTYLDLIRPNRLVYFPNRKKQTKITLEFTSR